jgi:hypothetical protein
MFTIDESDLLLKHPFNLVVSGGSQSGKTEWITRLIAHRGTLINTKFDKVVYCYGIYTPRVLLLQQAGCETVDGLPEESIYFRTDNLATLLILDDLLLEASETFLKKLFTRVTHHCNISTAFLTQNFFAKELRVARM